ncbi:50S ribosomal protein L29 [Candidatus Nomurabacteria bacterium RIFCSPLOWO2_01_FULL_39_18]|uniref:Large ribosomal subunit protein uL29 n=1 Tax=Candidatus Nomurabacteria bacterium RIFCSPHIGHO2_01_FULL_40_24b TaxID=1801739 RepID=A0A1F6V5V0_9BACT|nr:MAG: 50S ribosomal protein L29 [Candidatus Nomurabacteria bacterium RIFCSPHIGHO2_01_FULL_40_24b]OGI90725.1 MAG: 50S ribosomal protein L29 [Candidatus Nomurabacteria bacterium RIFCSPLOWO2_01_FULL_39_18]
MKKNKENLKGMKEEELKKELVTFREKIRVIRFKAEGSKSKNTKEESTLRKQIARILTALNNK